MFGLNPMELMIVGAIAVLLFGNKLPSVARSLGKSMTEFKKGISDIHEEVRTAGSTSSRASQQVSHYHEIDDREEATAPKFEPPVAEPTAEIPSEKPVEA